MLENLQGRSLMKHYIDLFDDALYEVGSIGSFDAVSEQMKNTVRLQVLISLLFRNQIIVPEQWALSSATFLQVANEVIDGYKRKIVLHNRSSPEKALIKPPIVVSFRRRDVTAESPFALAMTDRLNVGSRLMFSKKTGDETNENYNTARDGLKRVFQRKISVTEAAQFDDRFEDNIADIIDNDHMACNIRGLCEYLTKYSDPDFQPGRRSATEFHDVDLYTKSMAELASNVKSVCSDDPILVSQNDQRIVEFKEMFDRAEREEIPISSFMDMWRIAQEYSAPTSDLITRMGQYCMHRSIASSTHADFGSTFYGAYSGKSDDSFDQLVIGRTRAQEYAKAQKMGQDLDFRFLATTHAEKYDFTDKFDWVDVWSNVGDFSHSEEWKQTLQVLKNKLNNMDANEIHNEPFWNEIFDKINSNFSEFRITRHKNKEGLFEATLCPEVGFENLAGLGRQMDDKENIVISTYVMLAGWSSSYTKTTPLEVDLFATRNLREGKKVCTDIVGEY